MTRGGRLQPAPVVRPPHSKRPIAATACDLQTLRRRRPSRKPPLTRDTKSRGDVNYEIAVNVNYELLHFFFRVYLCIYINIYITSPCLTPGTGVCGKSQGLRSFEVESHGWRAGRYVLAAPEYREKPEDLGPVGAVPAVCGARGRDKSPRPTQSEKILFLSIFFKS